MSIGFTEILFILVILLLLFGSKKIPELAKALAKAGLEFKKAKESFNRETENLTQEKSNLENKKENEST